MDICYALKIDMSSISDQFLLRLLTGIQTPLMCLATLLMYLYVSVYSCNYAYIDTYISVSLFTNMSTYPSTYIYP